MARTLNAVAFLDVDSVGPARLGKNPNAVVFLDVDSVESVKFCQTITDLTSVDQNTGIPVM